MSKFCFRCSDIKDCGDVYVKKTYNVDNLEISIMAKYHNCKVCGNIFPSIECQDENFARVYDKYEKKTGKKPERIGFVE